jgi:hypothetical protein
VCASKKNPFPMKSISTLTSPNDHFMVATLFVSLLGPLQKLTSEIELFLHRITSDYLNPI